MKKHHEQCETEQKHIEKANRETTTPTYILSNQVALQAIHPRTPLDPSTQENQPFKNKQVIYDYRQEDMTRTHPMRPRH